MANEFKYDKDHIVENYRKYIKTQRIRMYHNEHGELFTYQDVCDMINVAVSVGNTSKTGESNCTIDSVSLSTLTGEFVILCKPNYLSKDGSIKQW